VLRGGGSRGSASLLLACGLVPLVVAMCGAIWLASDLRAGARAQTAADAAAHAALAVLAAGGHEEVSIALQSQPGACDVEGDAPPALDACAAAVAAARQAAAANGAALEHLTLGPDLRDMTGEAGSGRLLALAGTAVAIHPGFLETACAAGRLPEALCVQHAAGAAQER
jgi:hypothetical protein